TNTHPAEIQSSSKCIFGISNQPPNFPPGTNHHTEFSRNRSYVAISAPRNRVYWFMFVALGKTYYGSADIPRFTKHDEAALAVAHTDDQVTEDMAFGQLYDSRITSVLVALEEHVFARWHFGRIVLVGDSAHKGMTASQPHSTLYSLAN
ncbi:hypothetical protein CSAL01_12133, partial [Colletotrichum salicis]